MIESKCSIVKPDPEPLQLTPTLTQGRKPDPDMYMYDDLRDSISFHG